jgi:pimeloyl-ACP methyl ester carboxylesterase
MPSFHANGIDIHYEVHGDGEPLVLLHGYSGTHADWAHALDLAGLGRRFRVIAPDARGHGRSTNPGGAFSFRQCALDVLALMDHLGIERFSAVGASLGAKTLLHVGTIAPERTATMVLVSAAPYIPAGARELQRAAARAERSAEEWALMRARHAHGDDQIRALFELPARFAEVFDDMSFTPPLLSTIRARTLVVSGDRDPFYPVELAVEMYRAIPRATLWVIPNEGHSPIYGAWRESFERATLDFLAAS